MFRYEYKHFSLYYYSNLNKRVGIDLYVLDSTGYCGQEGCHEILKLRHHKTTLPNCKGVSKLQK